jgi:hypothetical protein
VRLEVPLNIGRDREKEIGTPVARFKVGGSLAKKIPVACENDQRLESLGEIWCGQEDSNLHSG